MVACCPIPIWQFPYQVSSPNQKTHGCQLSSYLVPKVPNGPLSLNHLLYHLPCALSLGLSLPPSRSWPRLGDCLRRISLGATRPLAGDEHPQVCPPTLSSSLPATQNQAQASNTSFYGSCSPSWRPPHLRRLPPLHHHRAREPLPGAGVRVLHVRGGPSTCRPLPQGRNL